jgi:hypothetical protein
VAKRSIQEQEINAYVSRAKPERKPGDMELADPNGKKATVTFLQKLSLTKFIDYVTGPTVENPPQKKAKAPPPPPLVSPNDPTPESKAKEPDGMTSLVVRQGTAYRPAETLHKIKEPVDVYKVHFTAEELWTVEQFVRDFEAASSYRITANYDGMSGSTPGPRSGGVTDHHRERYVRFSEILRALDDNTKSVLIWLVLCVRSEAAGRPPTVQEVGAAVTAFKHKEAIRGVGVGLMKATIWQLQKLYHKDRAHSLSRVPSQIRGPRR